jgi:hypothetical protein
MALSVRTESDGRCDRGISLGDEWARASSGKNVAGGGGTVLLALFRGLIYFQKMEATIADVV